jgi:hypothetical protein
MKKIYYPDFLIIPFPLIQDERITLVDERVYGIIYWMSKLKNEVCTASNQTFTDLIPKSSKRSIQRAIDKLEKFGYVKRLLDKNGDITNRQIIPLIRFSKASPEDVSREKNDQNLPEGGVTRMSRGVTPVSWGGDTSVMGGCHQCHPNNNNNNNLLYFSSKEEKLVSRKSAKQSPETIKTKVTTKEENTSEEDMVRLKKSLLKMAKEEEKAKRAERAEKKKARAGEPIVWEEELKKMENSKVVMHQILAFFFKARGIAPKTRGELEWNIGRYARSAAALSGYKPAQLKEAFIACSKEASELGYNWTLETVLKKINQVTREN